MFEIAGGIVLGGMFLFVMYITFIGLAQEAPGFIVAVMSTIVFILQVCFAVALIAAVWFAIAAINGVV